MIDSIEDLTITIPMMKEIKADSDKAYAILCHNGLLEKPKLNAAFCSGEKIEIEHHTNLQYCEIDVS